ncbi:MAG TPA: MipA/OmpV family protein [Mariprofundaceae bacterium]|nr:MipA/OmpV family protein [Mariprofundaceae bacterium]
MKRIKQGFTVIARMRAIRSLALQLTLALLLPATALAAENRPRWEAGIAVGVASLPQYMGSDERYTFAVPLPYIIYRSERLNFGRNGLRAELFDRGRLSVDLSLGAGMPVRNSNRARAGMPPLNFNLQAGPRINWQFYQTAHSALSLRLPWRGVMDIKGHYLGWVSEPDLYLRLIPSDNIEWRLTAGALFASARYNDTYYSVAPAYATATRPAYQARGGLHSLSLGASMLWTLDDRLRLFGSVRYRNLSPGVVAGSPLVKTPHYLSAAIGLAWSFYQSDERVQSGTADD